MAAMHPARERDSWSVLVVIGLGILLADLLVIFFAPAALRLGRGSVFVILIIALAIIGLALIVFGRNRQT